MSEVESDGLFEIRSPAALNFLSHNDRAVATCSIGPRHLYQEVPHNIVDNACDTIGKRTEPRRGPTWQLSLNSMVNGPPTMSLEWGKESLRMGQLCFDVSWSSANPKQSLLVALD